MMSTVEAAASLFGSEDSLSDPFTSLGTSPTSSQTPTYEAFNPGADPGLGEVDQHTLSNTQNEYSTSTSLFQGPQDVDHRVYHAPPFSNVAPAVEASRFEEPGSHYSGQQHTYETLSAQTGIEGHTAVQNYGNPYDPYGSQTTHALYSYDEPKRVAQPLPYDPYNTTTRSYPSPPKASAVLNSSPQPTYDLYKRAASPYQTAPNPTASQSYSIPYSSKGPTVQSAVLNRPKRVDAYDPPFPSSKPSKRVAGRSALQPFMSTSAQTAYGVYGVMADQHVPPGPPTLPPMPAGGKDGDNSYAVDDRVSPSLLDGNRLAPTHNIQISAESHHTTTGRTHASSEFATQHIGLSSHNPFTAHRTATQFTPPRPSPSDTISLTQTSNARSPDTGASGAKVTDNTNHDLPHSSSSPPTSPHFPNASYNSHLSEYYAPSQTSTQQAADYHDEYNQTQPGDVAFTSMMHDTGVRVSSIVAPEKTAKGPLSHDHLHSPDETDVTRHYSSFVETVDDDPEAVLGGQRVQSPDPQAPTASSEYQISSHERSMVTRKAFPPDPVLGNFGIESLMPIKSHAPIHNSYLPKAFNGDAMPSSSINAPETQSPPRPNGTSAPRPYSPIKSTAFGDSRDRSNSSAYPTVSFDARSHHPPPQHRRHVASELSDGRRNTLKYSYPSGQMKPFNPAPSQELLVGPTAQTPYAPSPSLLGLNDPLGRTTARVPVFSFGFGGKLVTCFHGSSALNTGFDVALASRRSMDVNIRVLSRIIPESALDSSTVAFPGPLFADPGTPTTSLVRPGVTAQFKAKKALLSQYLLDRSAEFVRGIGYLQPGSEDRRRLEGKLVLAKLLSVMVENEGRLSGSLQIETAVRAALVPRLALSGTPGPQDPSTTQTLGLSPPTDAHTSVQELTPFSYAGRGLSHLNPHETPISVSTLRLSALDKIQEFLLRGERMKACNFAMDEKLWAHAMLIASSIDKDMWKAVVSEFLKAELGSRPDASHNGQLHNNEHCAGFTNGLEGLRVAYSMFSGQGAACIQELLPQTALSRSLQIAGPSHVTPVTANFVASTTTVPLESLSKWPETVAMMLSNNMTIESSSALTALGDCLAHHGWIEAAHVCYLLAPQTSPIAGLGQPATRIVLLGSPSPLTCPNFHKDPDPIIFSEIVEFAFSIAAPAKGQEAFAGLPHLQSYKLLRAMSLAEVGQMQLASRYCEAINSTLSRASPYFTSAFTQQLRMFSERIIAAPQIEKPGSWIAGKMTKPSLDSIGTWLEGRFTKLITGDGDGSPGVVDSSAVGEQRSFSGPFSHYSAISSATTSTSPSPQPSAINLNTLPQRSGSAMSYPLVTNSHVPVDRASSAIDYTRRKLSPAPRISSANAATTTFAQSAAYSGRLPNTYSLNDPSPAQDALMHSQLADGRDPNLNEGASWWGSTYASESSARTPTATSYLRVDESRASSSSSGFISLMDDTSASLTPTVGHAREALDGEEEDLGFGNPKKREKPPKDEEGEESTAKVESGKATIPEQPKTSAVASGSWFSRFALWGRRDGTPGPIKANLGEEKSFYYDEQLKRWVNKKAAADDPAKPAVPAPPPSRSQTASPGRSGATFSPATGGPPVRPASAIDLASPPVKSLPRARSNLVPVDTDPSLPPAPASSPGGLPPPSRPRSQVAKRQIRSRYVDVFQQENAT